MAARKGLIALALASGCGGADTFGGTAVERDSSGIVIVENAGPYEESHLSQSPEVRIGLVDGDSAYQFHRIGFAGRLSDGRIVVANGGTSEIRWFSPAGEYRAGVGRQGQGPEEFGTIGSVLLSSSDTLIVHDPRNQRLTWIAPNEAIVREEAATGLPYGTVTILGPRPDGRTALAVSTPTFDLSHPDVSYTRDTLAVLLFGAGQADTVLRMAGQEGALWVRYSEGRPNATQQMQLPFAYPTLVAGAGADFVLARGEAHELAMFDAGAALERISRRKDLPIAVVTDRDRAEYVRRAVEAARARGQRNTTALADGIHDRLAVLPEGHAVPSFDRLLVDVEGRLWLRDYVPPWSSDANHVWTLYQPAGHVESRVTVPSSLEVMHIGRGYITGVTRDSLDVEYVVVHRIERD